MSDRENQVVEIAAKSLGLPAAIMSEWKRKKAISIKRIPRGWHLTLLKDEAASTVSAIVMKRLSMQDNH